MEREQKVATAGQCTLAVSPVPGPRMLLVSAMAILLLLLLCSGGIPILMLGSSHSCFVSEGVKQQRPVGAGGRGDFWKKVWGERG